MFRFAAKTFARMLPGEAKAFSQTVAEHPVPEEETQRAADRNLDPKRDTAKHQQWGTLWVGFALALALASGVGFVFAYWTGGNNMVLGGTLALFLGSLGVALVLYAHWLMARKEAIEPREELPSDPAECQEFAENFLASEQDIHRRSLLKWIGLATVGMTSAIVVSLIKSLGRPPGPSLFTTIWKRGQSLRTMDGTPVTVNALEPGSMMIVFPEGSIGDEKAQTVLIRVNQKLLRLPQERANWAPMGYVAYSRVCTHAGCDVGLFETTTDLLMCPCHQSTFDVLRAAQPTGGPAARPLPQLPLYADADGTLRAGGGFSEPPGPGFWGMPS
jgi:ubiquinol-cytochrome c reductase iron-sulfur subunit